MITDTVTTAHNEPLLPVLDELRSGPPTVSVERAATLLGVSRAHAYQSIKSGDLPVIRLGRKRVRVPTAALLRMLTGEGGAAAT